jgi:predicted flap endonuclease-1-like 5' DNA nuclease
MYRLVLDSVCRSNHHRIAVMALSHLKAEDAERWRDLFLSHRDDFLKGAKAPDEDFRDFKNHVLHIGDGDWGGAQAAAREWYRRTVRALSEKDWKHAAWCAGVMSHYAIDPIQPFHTGQTEEEGVIHRAAEYAFSRSFPEIHAIIENELGWPDVPVQSGDDWLEKMIRAGAVIANKHYDTVIDHYDLEAGRKKPQAGLDQELKDVIAALIAYATVMLSRIFDKAIAEAAAAGAAPQSQKAALALGAIAIVLNTPVRALAKRAADVAEHNLVAAQYAEFRRTGKVRETLSDDDKAVRRLHAEEVLMIPLASLDCVWPRETGTKHGQGAAPRRPGRKAKKSAEAKAPPPKAGKPAAPPKAKNAEPKPAKPKAKTPPLEKGRSTSAKQKSGGDQSAAAPRTRLSRDTSVVDAPSIGPKTAGRLNLIGVKTVGDLLEVSPEDAAQRIKQGHINARVIRDWQAQALLACSVPDLPGTAAQLLVGAGVSSLDDLAAADPDFLVDAIAMFAATPEGERGLRGSSPPDRDRVKAWIESALEICEKRSAA